jgi:ubiquinone/menaquinone biosynthesis C-methylase UbiE
MKKQWYEELFENYAKTYDKECYTQGTKNEVDFIEEEIGFDKSKKILDIGCGTGRHAIELSKRGYSVTGADLSESQLNRAKEKAEKENVNVDFILADARNLNFNNEFDLAIMLCEGAFPLMETDEMNFEILKNAKKALKPGGKLILTTLNALFPLFHSVQEFLKENDYRSKEHSFDLMTFREKSTVEIVDDSGKKKEITSSERYYIPSEMTWLLKSLGFKQVDLYGCQTGKFSRGIPLGTENFEMLAIAN